MQQNTLKASNVTNCFQKYQISEALKTREMLKKWLTINVNKYMIIKTRLIFNIFLKHVLQILLNLLNLLFSFFINLHF